MQKTENLWEGFENFDVSYLLIEEQFPAYHYLDFYPHFRRVSNTNFL